MKTKVLALLAAVALTACGDGDFTGRYDVVYEVTGSAQSASLTWATTGGGTSQQTVNLPWNIKYTMRDGDFVYISAQNQGKTGSVTTTIKADGKTFKSTTSTGAYVIATASGSCC